MAFGTGNHETTTMMIEAILSEEIKDKVILDMGCGTGILAILASRLGAAGGTAIDIDEWAYNGTKENTDRNGISNIAIFRGDASLLGSQVYDIVFANIQRNVILNDLPAYQAVLKKGGGMWLSGFYTRDLDAIKSRALENGLTFRRMIEKNNWVAALFSKD